MSNNNALGLDRYQIAVIKRNYSILKPFITKRNKAQEKIENKKKELKELEASLQAEIATCNEQIEIIDKFTKDITEKSCGGIRLSSEQVMHYLEHPEEFKNLSSTDNTDSQPCDLDAEEDKEWEDRINSGELKEVTYHENIGEGHDDGLGE